jgi:hypothetical protein
MCVRSDGVDKLDIVPARLRWSPAFRRSVQRTERSQLSEVSGKHETGQAKESHGGRGKQKKHQEILNPHTGLIPAIPNHIGISSWG